MDELIKRLEAELELQINRYEPQYIPPEKFGLQKAISIAKEVKNTVDLGSVRLSLPIVQEMDSEIISIMVDELAVEDGMLCNKFSTSLKIIDYIKKITGNEA